jgi:hypothetical protein
METATIFNLETLLSLVVFFFIVKWYVLPWLLKMGPTESLVPLLLFSAFRYTGLSFQVPNFTDHLPEAFATPAGYGDFTVGMIALVAAIAIKMNVPGSVYLAWLYALAGAADFVYAGSLAGANDVAHHIGPLWPEMAIFGPAWMISILFTFRLLIWPAPAVAKSK